MLKKIVPICVFLYLLAPVRANVAVVRVVGSSLRLEHSDAVEMLSEDIDIQTLGGKQLGIIEYHCHFVLHNTSEEESSFQVGFPLDEIGAPGPKDGVKSVKRYAFSARDSVNTSYEVRLVDGPLEAKHQYHEMFLWDMQLKASETRDLWVSYRLGSSIGPHDFRQTDTLPFPELTRACRLRDASLFGWGYYFGYTTSSGATWKGGHIGHARFTLHDKEFRAGMDARSELPAMGTRAEIAEDLGSFWFSGALPSSRVVTEDGYRWEFDNFVPGPKLEYVYGVCSFPTNVNEMEVSGMTLEQLKRLRQLLLAAYGGVPQDAELAGLVREEFWYHPDPNFREDALEPQRQAVLTELDRRIAEASKN